MDYLVSTPSSPAHRTPLSMCLTTRCIPALPVAPGVGHAPAAPAKSCHTTCPGETRPLPRYAPKDGLCSWLIPGQHTLCSVHFCCPALQGLGWYHVPILRQSYSRRACTDLHDEQHFAETCPLLDGSCWLFVQVHV